MGWYPWRVCLVPMGCACNCHDYDDDRSLDCGCCADDTPLDTVRDDGGAAGGSSFRGLLPAGATAPLAEDEKR